MAFKPEFKTTFEPQRVLRPIYTGGPLSLSKDGNILAACVDEDVQLSDLRSGLQLARIEGDGDSVTSITMTQDAMSLVICSRTGSMRWFALGTSNHDGQSFRPRLVRSSKPHSTPVVVSAIDETGSLLATGASDGVVKVWDLRGGYTTHTLHGHGGSIASLHFFRANHTSHGDTKQKKGRSDEDAEQSEDYRLASGDEHGKIRIWNLHRRKCIAVLESHASVVRSIAFNASLDVLASASRDRTVILWSAATWEVRQTLPVMEELESLGFLAEGRFFYTAGERGRLRIWHTSEGSEVTQDQESGVESEAILQVLSIKNSTALVSVHADQVLRFYDLSPLAVKTVTSIPPLPVARQISGTHDEVIDLAFIGLRGNLLALATNLEEIRITSINEQPGSYFGADVATLAGHSDIVISMSVDWSGCWLATGAKDNTARLWRIDDESNSFECVVTFTGHAESIGAIALPSSTPTDPTALSDPLSHPPAFLLTGSSDTTIKKWDISSSNASVKAKWTRKAHDKDINSLATSYSASAPLAASASQDKTVRIWDVDSGEAVGILRGHKRGVWTVAFAPSSTPSLSAVAGGGGASGSRGMVVTGSGDKTVRIWSLADYSCIRTFEGHTGSVLKAVWLPYSNDGQPSSNALMQVASAAGDGLVKVWSAQDGECAATLDNHVDRVWALAVKPDVSQRPLPVSGSKSVTLAGNTAKSTTTLVSGSADSTMTFWIDSTETTAKQANERATAKIEQDQELQNHIRAANYREAIVLALQLNHPKRLLGLFAAVINGEHEQGSLTGKQSVDEVLSQLSNSQLWLLLQRCRDWNANSRTYHVAQRIIWALLHLYPKEHLLSLRAKRKTVTEEDGEDLAIALSKLDTQDKRSKEETLKDLLDALKSYTERHDQRLAKLGEERFVLTWALQSMDGFATDDTTMVNGT